MKFLIMQFSPPSRQWSKYSRSRIFEFHKMRGIYRVAAQLVASRVVLSSTELYTIIIFVIYYY
jgi:hypothetical protein